MIIDGKDLSYADRLTHAIKSVKATMAMMDSDDDEGGGSYGYYPMMRRNGGSYDGGGYYARGRGNVRRNSNGRYSRNGYSRSDDADMVDRLRDVMSDAPDEMRQEIQRLIAKAERM